MTTIAPNQTTDLQIKPPSMVNVFILNDATSPFGSVVSMLRQVFSLSSEKAQATMLHAHRTGRALVGTFTKDVAETKSVQGMQFIQQDMAPRSSEFRFDLIETN